MWSHLWKGLQCLWAPLPLLHLASPLHLCFWFLIDVMSDVNHAVMYGLELLFCNYVSHIKWLSANIPCESHVMGNMCWPIYGNATCLMNHPNRVPSGGPQPCWSRGAGPGAHWPHPFLCLCGHALQGPIQASPEARQEVRTAGQTLASNAVGAVRVCGQCDGAMWWVWRQQLIQ